MVLDSDIEVKIEELRDAEEVLRVKLNNIKQARSSLELIRVVEQKELISGSEDTGDAKYKINTSKKTDPQTLETITDSRRDEIFDKINKNLTVD